MVRVTFRFSIKSQRIKLDLEKKKDIHSPSHTYRQTIHTARQTDTTDRQTDKHTDNQR